uniref:hypothetical protein n=1 Tax=Natronococcus amylolyticus TaxID=44470 RepID=UPI001F4D2DAF|nr:hypothetical protein [Natronococcus amylolyticus]
MHHQQRCEATGPAGPIADDKQHQQGGDDPLLVGQQREEKILVEEANRLVDVEVRPLAVGRPLEREHAPDDVHPEQDADDGEVQR